MTLNPLVSVKWLAKNLDIPNLVILDASTQKNASKLVPKYLGVQIKGARIFDMESTFFDEENPIPNMMPNPKVFETECQKLGIHSNSIIVIYDNLGVYTSPRARWMFKAMGHQYVTVLNGGLTAWKEAGYACEEKKEKTYKLGDFKALHQPNLVRDSKFILNNLQNKEVLVVDARSNDRFLGESPEPRAGMASGHIPNAISFPYKQVLEEGKMKSKNDLLQLIEDLKVDNKELVFTCGSGVTACIILLAFELVNDNQKSLYDGSWSEWGQLGKFPVEVG
ncbi:sulfurtransferase [Lutibacter holmesii]|uniref:Sulfurtransferase n=1 Tax=Lutibacter holmesii TaxID=1137985 RepID=A0ABW3WM11_9FLAO